MPGGHSLRKTWLVVWLTRIVCMAQEIHGTGSGWRPAPQWPAAHVLLFSGFRICEPTRTLLSFVSTNNLMLLTFKAPQIRRLSGIRAYFEVIPEQSKSYLAEKKVTLRSIYYNTPVCSLPRLCCNISCISQRSWLRVHSDEKERSILTERI